MDIYRGSKDYEDGHHRHLFVTALRPLWETIRIRIEGGEPVIDTKNGETVAALVELQLCMVRALRWSLLHAQPDGGAYTALKWIKGLLRCYNAAKEISDTENTGEAITIPFTADSSLRPTFLLILRLLDTCLYRGLLTDQKAAGDVARLLALLGDPELPALPADLEAGGPGIGTHGATDEIVSDPDFYVSSKTTPLTPYCLKSPSGSAEAGMRNEGADLEWVAQHMLDTIEPGDDLPVDVQDLQLEGNVSPICT